MFFCCVNGAALLLCRFSYLQFRSLCYAQSRTKKIDIGKTMNHSINPRSNADERSQLEDEFARQHASDTDEQLLSYVGSIASKLGRKPTKEETIGYRYIKSRLGNWPGIMVKLGLLEPKSVRRERVRRSIADKQKDRSKKN